MIQIQVHVDERTAAIGRGAAKLLTRRAVRYGLLVSVLALPVAAIAAPLTVPSTFSAGTVISSAAMNTNFTAIETSVNDNDTRIGLLEGEVRPHACEWAVAQTPNSASVVVTCPASKYVVSGGCHRNSTASLIFSLPGSTLTPDYPNDGDAPTAVSAWSCAWDAVSSTGHWAKALCCAF
jgi:hypothetical protein